MTNAIDCDQFYEIEKESEIKYKRARSQKWGDTGDKYERDVLRNLRRKNWTK